MAIELSSIIRADPPCPPSDKLMNLMAKHVKDELPKESNIYEEISGGIGEHLIDPAASLLKLILPSRRSRV